MRPKQDAQTPIKCELDTLVLQKLSTSLSCRYRLGSQVMTCNAVTSPVRRIPNIGRRSALRDA